MLEFAHHADRPFLRLLVLHDDAEREFAYTAGAEEALARAGARRLDGGRHQGRLGQRLLSQLFSRPPTPRPTSPRPTSTARPRAILAPSRLSQALKRLTRSAVDSGATR